MSALVIIDMQKEFEASGAKRVIQACQREITYAMENHEPILLVEYHPCDYRTRKKISKLVKGYRHCHVVCKYQDDGSREIFETLMKNEYPTDRIRICGVNAHACVRDTVKGLERPTTKIIAVADAINDNWPNWQDDSNEHRAQLLKTICGYHVEVECALELFSDSAVAA